VYVTMSVTGYVSYASHHMCQPWGLLLCHMSITVCISWVSQWVSPYMSAISVMTLCSLCVSTMWVNWASVSLLRHSPSILIFLQLLTVGHGSNSLINLEHSSRLSFCCQRKYGISLKLVLGSIKLKTFMKHTNH